MAKDTSWKFSKCIFVEQIFHGKTFHLSCQSSRFEDYGQLTRERARIPPMLVSMRCHVPRLTQMEGYIKRTWGSRWSHKYCDHGRWIDFRGYRHGCQRAGSLGFFTYGELSARLICHVLLRSLVAVRFRAISLRYEKLPAMRNFANIFLALFAFIQIIFTSTRIYLVHLTLCSYCFNFILERIFLQVLLCTVLLILIRLLILKNYYP